MLMFWSRPSSFTSNWQRCRSLMGKQKQQVISRFFAPIRNPPPAPSPSSSPSTTTKPSPPPKVSATASFSPSKRQLALALSSPSKKHKTLSPPPLPPPHSSAALHQKFLRKLLDPPPPPAPQNPSPAPNHPKYTPLEQQVMELRSRHPDVLLMVEVGYKYRFFGPDAETAARVLGIVAHVDHNFLTASVPSFRLQFHVRRLVGAGHKVGVVRQTETAAIKAHGANRVGPFARGLSALYTKATVEAAEEMGAGEGEREGRGNYLMCVVERDGGGLEAKIGVVGIEISTGEVMHGEFGDGVMRSGLEAVVLSLSPVEILLGDPLSAQTEKLLMAYSGSSSNVRVERTSRDCFKDGGALAEVVSLYETISEDSSSLDDHESHPAIVKVGNRVHGIEGIMALPELVVQALALTVRYLKQFGFERILCLGASFQPFCSNVEMTLSANTLQQLEVLKNSFDGSENGSLLKLMDHTHTVFGSRLLKHWITHPLCQRNSISARLDAVCEIAGAVGSCGKTKHVIEIDEDPSCSPAVEPKLDFVLSLVLTTLGGAPDVQRGITRIFYRTATVAEFIAVIHAILVAGNQLRKLNLEDDNGGMQEGTVRSPLLRRLILTASSSAMISHACNILSSLNKEAATQRDLCNLFNVSNGQFPEVARSHTAVNIAKEKLDLLISQYRKQLGMRNLEFMSVSGSTHLIELSSDVKVPSNWVKVNSTKKTIRYHPPEVVTALDKLALATEELTVTCRATWDKFLMGFGSHYAEFQAAVQALAALDCLHSLAILSRTENYVRPVFVDDGESCQIQISAGRHPVLESILQNNFVPNDTDLNANGERCQIITGPNMGGKSCYIRQVALIAIMAQVGSFVPASSAKLHVLDGLYTRMGASDSIQRGTSTFFEELNEASHILKNCTSESLVIVDELGRGTSTHDGVAIAYATLHYLLEKKKCLVLFVTHYPKVLDIKDDFPSAVKAYHVSYLTSPKISERDGSRSNCREENLDHVDLTFLYKVVPGMSDKSFGLHVASLAQLPPVCIARAAVMAAKLEAEVSIRAENQFMGKFSRLNPSLVEEDKLLEEHFHSAEFSCREELSDSSIVSDGYFDDLADAYRALFSLLQSASCNADLAYSLSSLKNAKLLATELLSR